MKRYIFVVNENIDVWDCESTTKYLVHCALEKCNNVIIVQCKDLYLRSFKGMTNIYSCQYTQVFQDRNIKNDQDLALIDTKIKSVFILRIDPPITMQYVSVLHVLMTCQYIYSNITVINSCESILNFPEKMSPVMLHEISIDSLITSKINCMKNFFVNVDSPVVIKPLYDGGGRGINIIRSDIEMENFINENSFSELMVIQKFIPEIELGDKRILFIKGKICGCYVRRPQQGKYVANIAQGGKSFELTLNTRDNYICSLVSKFLIYHDIFFAGIDIIGDYLTEINITCPRGACEIKRLYDIDISEMFFSSIC